MQISGQVMKKIVIELPPKPLNTNLVIVRIDLKTKNSVQRLRLGVMKGAEIEQLSGFQTFEILPQEVKTCHKRAIWIQPDDFSDDDGLFEEALQALKRPRLD